LIDSLRRFWRFLLSIFVGADHLPDRVLPEEPVSRFILDKDQFRQERGFIYPAAFLPSKKTANTSVYRVESLPETRIWQLAEKFVTALRADKKRVLARADIKAKTAFHQDLAIQPDRLPHPRHANIINWPTDRSAQKAKALELAKNAKLRVRPEAASS